MADEAQFGPTAEFTQENSAVVTWLINVHKPDADTGRCLNCGGSSPCPARRAALEYTQVHQFLPPRQRNAKRPEFIGDFWNEYTAA